MDYSSSNKIMKQFLLNLQSNGDKENLMEASIHLQDNMAIDNSGVRLVRVDGVERRKNLTLAELNPSFYKQLIHEDLISTVGPSEKYWTIIAERRRKVLAAVIKEHQRLNTVIIALEEENMCCKQLLENTTVLVRALKEMINAKDTESDDNPSGVTEDSDLNAPGSADEQHVHKKMKLSGSADENSDGN